MTALVERKDDLSVTYSPEHISLIKNQICKGATDLEMQLFLHVCYKKGLDPLTKQIYSVKYGQERSIIVGIDGFRLVAERTGCYAPGKESTYVYDAQGRLQSATSYVKKMTRDGTWHEVSESAYWAEYGSDKQFWKKMPHVMLAKCAEAKALRRAFPNELSGLYTQEEMEQANKKQDHDEDITQIEVHEVPSEEKAINCLRQFTHQFVGEEPELMEEYISRYATHYKKTLWEAYTDYKDHAEKFAADFGRWKIKHQTAA